MENITDGCGLGTLSPGCYCPDPNHKWDLDGLSWSFQVPEYAHIQEPDVSFTPQ